MSFCSILRRTLFAGLIATPATAFAHGLEIDDVRGEAAAAGESARVFLTVENEAFHPVYLQGAQSAVAAKVELHKSAGSAMEPVKIIEIPLSDRLDLRKAGYHLMLIGLKRPLASGDSVPVRLDFGDGQFNDVEVRISAATR